MPLVKQLTPLRGWAGLAGRALLDAFYPLECAGCGSSGKVICDACSVGLPTLLPPFCDVCATPGDFARCPSCADAVRQFDGIRAPYRYDGTVRHAILAMKYGGIKAASSQLGDLMADYLDAHPLPGDLLAAVPMPPRRRRERGYNQAELLARRLANRCGRPFQATLLRRTRHVDPQAGTGSAAERVRNVAGSVAVAPDAALSDAAVLLIDDVATTGSTLDTCAAALKEAGAASVWGLTLAVAGGQSPAE